MRQRLSWDKEKKADIDKQADPYTMNQNHANNPVEKYKNWDTETGGEAVDTRTPWKGEGRSETGHPAPERAAVTSALKLEDKAIKCITIAQRMLPGSTDGLIEEQATDLMYLPEKCIQATLARQASLAEALAAEPEGKEAGKIKGPGKPDGTGPMSETPECPKNKPEVEAKKEEKDPPAEVEAKKEEKDPPAEVEAKKEEKDPPAEVEAKKEEKDPPAEVEAKKEEKDPPAEVEAKKEDEISLEPKEAGDMLDQLFETTDVKAGAKKLSGIVKQASSSTGSLEGIWDSPPDVSKTFK